MATKDEIALIKAEELPITTTPETSMVISAEDNILKRFPTTFITDQISNLQDTTAHYAFETLQEAQDKWASFSQGEKDALDGKTFIVSSGNEAGEYSWQSSETGGTRFERDFSVLSEEDKTKINAIQLGVDGNQISNNSLMQNRSLKTTGSFGSPSDNWLSLPFQPIPKNTQITFSGFGPSGTNTLRYAIIDNQGTVIESELAEGAAAPNNPITITTPDVDGIKIAFNIASGSGVGTDPSNSPYRNTFMLNEGDVAKPFEEFLGLKISTESINFDFDNVAYKTGVVEDGNTEAVSGGQVYDFVGERLDNNIVLGNNLIKTDGQFISGSYIGAIGNTYSTSTSNNWISIQPIVVDGGIFKIGETYTLSGQGGVSASSTRMMFIDENNIILDRISGTGTSQASITPVTFTIPVETTKILLNIAGTSGSGLNPEQSPYHDTLMLNIGALVKPYSKFGYKLNLKQKICYISPTGNDDNFGTESSPIYSISKAKELLGENGQLIFMSGDYYDYDLDLSAFKVMKGLTGSKVRFIYGHRIDEATLVSGFSKVYSSPYTHSGTWQNVYSLWQHDIEDDRTNIEMDKRHIVHNGLVNRLQSYRLTSVDSIEEVESSATPCYYYDSDANVMYFQKVNGSDLSLNPIIIPNSNSIIPIKDQEVNHINFSVLYRAIVTRGLTGELRDISCMYVNNLSGCFSTNNTISLRLVRCRAGGGSNDGFNGHRTTTVTDVYNNYVVLELVDCWAHDCIDDAESHHGYCRLFFRGGLYEYSGSGCTPATGCHGYYENVTVQNCEVTGFQAQGSSADGGVGTNIHCYNCVSDSNGKNYEGRGDDSRFVNSISITPTISHISGTYREFNLTEIN